MFKKATQLTSLSLLGTIALTMPNQANAATLVNPGFETGDLTGWTEATSGTTVVTIGALDDTYSAQIVKQNSGTLSQGFSAMTGTINVGFNFSATDPGGATDRVLHFVLVGGGDSLINFRLVDEDTDGDGDLQAFSGSAWESTGVKDVAFTTKQAFSLTINDLGGVSPTYDVSIGTSSATGLTIFQTTPTAASSLDSILFAHGAQAAGSTLLIDNVYIPEPSSLALFGLGGLLIARRRRG